MAALTELVRPLADNRDHLQLMSVLARCACYPKVHIPTFRTAALAASFDKA